MKKVIAIFAIAALASCGGGSSTETKTDSTTVKCDTMTCVKDSVKTDSTTKSVDSTK